MMFWLVFINLMLKTYELLYMNDFVSAIEICDETTCRFGGTCDYDAEGSHGCVCNFACDAIR